MTQEELIKVIVKGENEKIEFKEARNTLPRSFFETVCAFLNHDGGIILLGVADNKEIIGVDSEKAMALCKDISNTSNNPEKLTPSYLLHPEIIDYKGKKIIHVFIPASSLVHRCNAKIYDRSVDGDYVVKNDEQVRAVYLRKSTLYTENTIYPFLNEKHFVPGIVERVRKIIKVNRITHPWDELTNIEFFRVAGLYREDITTGKEGFTMAALLLFGKEEIILSALPHYKIDALLRREDIERYDDRINIRCNLIEAYDLLINFVAKHLPDKFYLEGNTRIALRDVIFREIISNLLIHREYTNAAPATFIIYANSVEVKNANKPHYFGKLIPGRFEAFPKNPILAKLFTQMGRAEELGTGIRKVYKYLHAYTGNDLVTFEEDDLFLVKISLGSLFPSPNINGTLNGTLNEGQQKVLDFLVQHSGVQTKEIIEHLNIPLDTLNKHIRFLVKNKYIERRGSKKTGGYWIVIKP